MWCPRAAVLPGKSLPTVRVLLAASELSLPLSMTPLIPVSLWREEQPVRLDASRGCSALTVPAQVGSEGFQSTGTHRGAYGPADAAAGSPQGQTVMGELQVDSGLTGLMGPQPCHHPRVPLLTTPERSSSSAVLVSGCSTTSHSLRCPPSATRPPLCLPRSHSPLSPAPRHGLAAKSCHNEPLRRGDAPGLGQPLLSLVQLPTMGQVAPELSPALRLPGCPRCHLTAAPQLPTASCTAPAAAPPAPAPPCQNPAPGEDRSGPELEPRAAAGPGQGEDVAYGWPW